MTAPNIPNMMGSPIMATNRPCIESKTPKNRLANLPTRPRDFEVSLWILRYVSTSKYFGFSSTGSLVKATAQATSLQYRNYENAYCAY